MKFLRSSTFIGYGAGLLASFFWGIHSVMIRHLTEQGVSPNLIAGLRLYIGTLTLLVIFGIQRTWNIRKKLPPLTFTPNRLFWIAAVSLGVNFLFFQTGLRYTLASDANLIQNFSPVAVLIISTIFISHRIREIAPNKVFWTKVFQIVLLGSIGASLVLVNDSNNTIVTNNLKFFGDFLEFAGMVFFSIFVICSSEYAKVEKNVPSLFLTMLTLAVAAIPVSFFVPFGELFRLNAQQWFEMLFIGVFSTGVAYWLWHIASKRLNVIPLTLNLVYIGIITIVSEVLFLKIALDWKFVLGGFLMIIASVAAEIINLQAKDYRTRHEISDFTPLS
jgi:drug/metabolite transporter (DMT)-like permease